jgi:lysozyme family protein
MALAIRGRFLNGERIPGWRSRHPGYKELCPMSYPSYEALRPSYAKLWTELEPAPERVPALNRTAGDILAHKAIYQRISAATGVPWFVVALIDQMEHEPKLGLCNSHLHNGDPLTARTVNVPAGRPPGAPPFTFEQSAIDALIFDDLDKVPRVATGPEDYAKGWPIERVAYQLEKYNGGGYLDKPIVSPYLASWSNKYTSGKYVADHVYDANAVSAQPGALTILKILATLDPEVAAAIAPAAPVSAPPPQPTHEKEAPMATTAPPLVPTQAPPFALPAFNLNKVEVDLEMLAPVITMIAGLIPGGAVVVPFIPVVKAGLKLAAEVTAAPDAVSKLAAVEAHLHDIADLFGQVKTALVPAK